MITESRRVSWVLATKSTPMEMAEARALGAPDEASDLPMLQNVVVVSSSLSGVSGLAISFLSWQQARSHSSAPHLHVMQRTLAHLGLADAIFAASFLLAQARDASASGGPACQIAAGLNEFGGLVSTWWTCVMAWVVHEVLLVRRSNTSSLPRRFSCLALGIWGVPLVLELALFATLYVPRDIFGPERKEPWCHWRHDAMAVALPMYLNGVLAMAFVCWTYGRVCCHYRTLHGEALLSEQQTLANRAELASARSAADRAIEEVPLPSPQRLWTLDRRLASYLLAYLVSQGPSIIHRIWQAVSQLPRVHGVASPPGWLAVAQASTQPAQGTLNALVFLHHSTRAWPPCAVQCMAGLRGAIRSTERTSISVSDTTIRSA